MSRCFREPTLQETLSDPVIRAVMEADGVDARELEATLDAIARTLRMRLPGHCVKAIRIAADAGRGCYSSG